MLSIVVPVYNVKEYVEKCLNSLYTQKLTDYEVIVVDDGSTDGSGELIDTYCKGKANFYVYHKENGGLMSAWVFGVGKTKGDYIGFVDSDDYIAEDMFFKMYDKAIQYDSDMVMCDYMMVETEKIIGNSKSFLVAPGFYQQGDMSKIREQALPNPRKKNVSMARWNKIFRRELLLDNLKYCECLSKTFEDRYIVPACLFSAGSFYYIDSPLYYYVRRKGSNSGMHKQELLSDIKRMYDVQRQALEDKGLMERYRDLYEKAYMDYIRQYIARNILNVKGFRSKYQSAKQLLHDELTKRRMNVYGHLLVGKIGLCMRTAFIMRMPIILVLGSYLV